jgi:hypothetical protein
MIVNVGRYTSFVGHGIFLYNIKGSVVDGLIYHILWQSFLQELQHLADLTFWILTIEENGIKRERYKVFDQLKRHHTVQNVISTVMWI